MCCWSILGFESCILLSYFLLVWGFFNHSPIQGTDSDELNLAHQIVATLVKCMIDRKKTDFHGLKIDFH